MADLDPDHDPERIAEALLQALDTGGRVAPISARNPDFSPTDAARVAAAVARRRAARGERPVGRKIGFTNTTIWPLYGVDGPIWGHVFDTTLHDPMQARFAVAGLAEPRIEPEIVFGLARAPEAGMGEADLLGCVAWVAHGFEIVQSVFPGWRFTAPDATAAFGLHGALLVGPRLELADAPAHAHDELRAALGRFSLSLARDGVPVDEGHARNVLGGPLPALRHLVETLAREADAPPLRAGEIVTTGTLTDAHALAPGQMWTTAIEGLALPGLRLEIA